MDASKQHNASQAKMEDIMTKYKLITDKDTGKPYMVADDEGVYYSVGEVDREIDSLHRKLDSMIGDDASWIDITAYEDVENGTKRYIRGQRELKLVDVCRTMQEKHGFNIINP
jgi:hypothetical protein